MAIYSYKVPGLQRVPAQVAGEVCAALERSEAGLTPASLVEVSRPASAPLHNEFEWDDLAAAEKYRQTQAAALIRNITVTVSDCEDSPRAFVHIRASGEASNFISLSRVLDSEAWKAHMLQTAQLEMQAFIAKYQTLEQLSGVIREMKRVV